MSKETLKGIKEKYKTEIKYLNDLTRAIEQSISEYGIIGNIAKDGLSSHFNDRLDKLFLTIHDQVRLETIKEVEEMLDKGINVKVLSGEYDEKIVSFVKDTTEQVVVKLKDSLNKLK